MIEKPYIKIKRLNDSAVLPSKRDEDAGFDIYAIHENDFAILAPGEIKMFRTGISIEIPKNWVFYIAERGSTGSKGLARRCGVIDSGFRGELFVPLNNTSNKPIIFAESEGEKLDIFLQENGINRDNIVIYPNQKAIAQGMLLYCPHIDIEEVDELQNNTQRGGGCLGSTNA